MKQRIEAAIWKTKEKKTPKQRSKKEKRILKNEVSLRNLWDNMKHNYIHIVEIPE